MDIKMQVAFVGFVGVLFGAIVSVLGQFLDSLRTTRRDNKAKRLLVIRAARLVADELNNANSAIIMSHSNNRWYFDPDLCRTVDWKEHRGTIAPELPYDEWLALCDGALAIKIVRDTRSLAYDPNDPSLTEQTFDVIKALGPKVEKALAILQPYAAGRFKSPHIGPK